MTSRSEQAPIIRSESTPIYPSSVYTFPTLDDVVDFYSGPEQPTYLYRRNGHPNENPVEQLLAEWEHTEAATLFSSGMAAISQACMAVLRPGDHILTTQFLYGGTYALFEKILRPWGIKISYLNVDSRDELEAAIKPNTKLIYAETIANPLVQVVDLATIGEFAKQHNLLFFVDNTFATPLLNRPIEHGADLSIHSLTKFLNGHSDVIGGAAVGSAKLVAKVRAFSVTFGGTFAPFDAWLTERGMKTFLLRYPVACSNALKVAEFLVAHPNVKEVYYPGLPSHPTHHIATQMLDGQFGAMLSFEVASGREGANRIISAFEHIRFAPSLGGIETTCSHPALTSHRAYSVEEREALGIREGLIRISVGIEPIEKILADLSQAFA